MIYIYIYTYNDIIYIYIYIYIYIFYTYNICTLSLKWSPSRLHDIVLRYRDWTRKDVGSTSEMLAARVGCWQHE